MQILLLKIITNQSQSLGLSNMNTFEITYDEQYQLIKLYDLLRDTNMIEDLPPEITTFFDKLTH